MRYVARVAGGKGSRPSVGDRALCAGDLGRWEMRRRADKQTDAACSDLTTGTKHIDLVQTT
jgi:hypothetical protein